MRWCNGSFAYGMRGLFERGRRAASGGIRLADFKAIGVEAQQLKNTRYYVAASAISSIDLKRALSS